MQAGRSTRLGTFFSASLVTLVALAAPVDALAQAYPSKPIKLVLAQPPGGATDLFARLLSQKMSESLGQPVVIEYKPGANNMIAIQAVSGAPKDGYTLMMGTTALGMNPIMYKKLNYKVEDFAPISVVALPSFAMSVSKNVPAKTLREFVDYVKARPGKLNYGTLGPGSTGHLLGLMFEEIAGLKMQDVPYKGAAAALTGLIAGDVAVYFDNITTSVPQHRTGAITVMGVTAEARVPAAPDIPTMKEQGVPMVAQSWFGILAPAGTPRPIILRLNKEIQAAVAWPEYQSKLNAAGATPASSASPEEFATLIANLTELWGRIPRRMALNFD